MMMGKESDNLGLNQVGILILINHDMGKPL